MEVRCEFHPVQEGSGEPSPSNVRNITGWDGIKLYHSKNLRYRQVEWLCATAGIPMDTHTTEKSEIRAEFFRPAGDIAQYIYVTDSVITGSSNTTAYLSSPGSTGNWRFGNRSVGIITRAGINLRTKQNRDGVWVNDELIATYGPITAFRSNNPFTIHSSARSSTLQVKSIQQIDDGVLVGDYIPVHDIVDDVYGWLNKVTGYFNTNASATITHGEESPDPVVCATYDVEWEDKGTMYGGYVDVSSGRLVATHIKDKPSELTYNPVAEFAYYQSEYDFSKGDMDAISNMAKVIGVMPMKPITNPPPQPIGAVFSLDEQNYVNVFFPGFGSQEEYNSVVEDLEFILPLTYTIVYQIDTLMIPMFEGDNVIYCNSGDVTVYLKKK